MMSYLTAILMSILVAIEGDICIELAVMLLQHLVCSLLVNDGTCILVTSVMAKWMSSNS